MLLNKCALVLLHLVFEHYVRHQPEVVLALPFK